MKFKTETVRLGMRIVRIQSDKKYAKLDDDITFTIEYESPLTDEEMKAMQALDTNKPSHNPEDPANETRLMGLKIHD